MGLQRVGHDLVTEQQQTMHWEIKKLMGLFYWAISLQWSGAEPTLFLRYVCIYTIYYILILYIWELKLLICVQLFLVPLTVAYQTPLSMELSRPEYWNGLSFPSARDLPDPKIEPRSPALQADTLLSEPRGKPLCVCIYIYTHMCVCTLINISVWIYVCMFYSFQSSMISERKRNDQWEKDLFLQL